MVLHLVKQIVRHAARQVNATVLQQPQHDEVAVPAIQFVEPPARNDIGRAGDFSGGIHFEGE